MTYRWWHPPAVSLVAVVVRHLVPSPWAELIALGSALVLLAFAAALFHTARRHLRACVALRVEVDATLARVEAAARAVPVPIVLAGGDDTRH